jgi:methylglyoxal synthase/GNAT superfamily N-acetyltransferase
MGEAVGVGRLDHFADFFGEAQTNEARAERPSIALTAERSRRADLIAWASANAGVLATMRLLAPTDVGALLADEVGLVTEPMAPGPARKGIDAMVAFTDPIELRPGDTMTRSLTRLGLSWDIPVAGNRATADLLLAAIGASPLQSTVDRGTESKLWTVRATVDDVPGRLATLAASLARLAINILSVQVHLTPDGPVDELLVAANPDLSATDITAAVTAGGARTPRVSRADAHALVDAPTRALNLATRLLGAPDDLATVLASLLPGGQLVWRAEPPPARELAERPSGQAHEDTSSQLWLTDPSGGGFLLTRPSAPFTPAEIARAYAMVDVAVVALTERARAEPGPARLLMLADGTEIALRPAGPDDAPAIAHLQSRCSLTTRRYAREAGHAVVVEDTDGRVIAVGTLTRQVDGAELALLVDERWRRRRIGSLLAKRLVAVALDEGISRIRATVHTPDPAMVRIVSGLAHRLHREYDEGKLTLIATVVPPNHLQRSPSSSRLPHS